VALDNGRVVARAAWVQPPGAVGANGTVSPGRALPCPSRPGVSRFVRPPGWPRSTSWCPASPIRRNWLIAVRAGEPAGLVGVAGEDACFPQLTYLGLLDPTALGDLLIATIPGLVDRGAREVVADADAHRVATVAELERTGFRRVRSRIPFTPPPPCAPVTLSRRVQ
jgi:hypothetical protein